MPTYSAECHTDAEWAMLDIKAATPEKALKKARAVEPDTLDFEPYDDPPGETLEGGKTAKVSLRPR